MNDYEDLTCPKCNGQMNIDGKYLVCPFCNHKMLMRKGSKKKNKGISIENSFNGHIYIDKRNTVQRTNIWDVLLSLFSGEFGFIFVGIFIGLLLISLLVIPNAIDNFIHKDERLAEQEAYETYLRSVPHAKLPISLLDAEDANYEDVVSLIEKSGFTNVSAVKTQPGDIIDKIATADDTVLDLTIEGKHPIRDKEYPLDAQIIVYYYDKW